MKIETKEIYKCDHCNKLYQIKKSCIIHEERCGKNPDNERACFGCRYLTKKSETIYYDTFNGEGNRNVELLYCSKLDHFLFPPKVEHKGNQYETDPKENKPMPRVCEYYDGDLEPLF